LFKPSILTNKSVQQPIAIIKDMLVRNDKFTLSTDFVVMEMEECMKAPLILERPFLKTTRVVIDVDKRRVKLQIQNEILVMHI